MLCVEVKEKKICDWRGKCDRKLRDRFYVLWLLLRPLPWQVRLHGRSKKLNKSIYFFVLGGRWHGDYSFIIFRYPGSPPAGVWCFFAFLFLSRLPFFFSYVNFSRFSPLPNLQRFTVEMPAREEGKAEGTIYWNTSILYTWYTYLIIMLICYT